MELVTAPDALPVLADLLDDPIVVVDVGARWGVAQVWDRLGDKSLTIGFEPDEEECARLTELHAGTVRRRFVPVALGAETGLATLYLTKDRKGCSIYPPDDVAVTRHPGLFDGQLEDHTVIDLMALDDWCATAGIASVDAMKIDTQGSERDVLAGARRTLAAVRLVEVEVEFNPLYQGIPLFGDVDRFLRSQGFVLWKLSNLAHYAQEGMPAQWRSLGEVHFDDATARFPVSGGQLYWANAFYVRREMAYPDGEQGWKRLVRDGAIAYAYGLYDLAGVLLRLASSVAPAERRQVIDAALVADGLAALKETSLAAAATVLEGSFRLDVADPSFVGSGWYPPLVMDWGAVRWSGPGRDAWIDVPVLVGPGTRVELLFAGFMTPEIAGGLRFEVNGIPVQLAASPHEHGSVYAGVVPEGYQSGRGFTRLMVRCPATVPWNVANPGSDDDLELGAAVSWVRLTSPEV